MKNLHERLIDACIELSAGEVICFDDDVLRNSSGRLIRGQWADEGHRDEFDYVISGHGQRVADRMLKVRDSGLFLPLGKVPEC